MHLICSNLLVSMVYICEGGGHMGSHFVFILWSLCLGAYCRFDPIHNIMNGVQLSPPVLQELNKIHAQDSPGSIFLNFGYNEGTLFCEVVF